MEDQKDTAQYFISALLELDGPVDSEVRNSAVYPEERYSELLDRLLDLGDKYHISDEDKMVLIDAMRMCLEGIDEYEFLTLTGNEKIEFLNFYGSLPKKWNLKIPKLAQYKWDSPEYKQKAEQTGLIAEMK